MSTTNSIAMRFWLGMVLPTACLVVVTILLATIAGKGREFAPIVLLLVSLVIVPATMLANGWLLFVAWRRGPFVAAAFVLPTLVAIGMAAFLQSPHYDRGIAAAVLDPFLTVLQAASKHPVIALMVWVLAIAALILLARRTRSAE